MKPIKHVVISHRYFWPQNYPYAEMLREISLATRERVERVTVLSTSPPDLEERALRRAWADDHGVVTQSIDVGDVRTSGAARKVASHVVYAGWLFWQLVRLRPDTTFVASTPPVIAGLAVRLASRLTGGGYIYHLQDIHPEALMAKQDAGRPALAYRIALAVDTRTVEDAEVVIVLSEDMKTTLLERGVDPANIRVVNNFVTIPDGPEPLAEITPDQPFRLLFAGGIGPFQQLDRVLEVASHLGPEDNIVFDIMGDGPCRRGLESKYGDLPQVNFLGQRSRPEAHAAMCRASCGIVSLLPRVTKVAYPSKVIDYSVFGLPIFAMVDASSQLAGQLRASGVAYVPASDSPSEVARGLVAFRDRMVANPPDRDALARLARDQVAAEIVVPQLADLVAVPVALP